MKLRSLALIAGIALLAGACTDSRLVKNVSEMKPTQSGFKAGLHGKYVKLAKAELEEGDYFDTGIFARRAEAAANGKNVDPDTLWERSYSKKNKKLVFKERGRLMAMLNGGGREKFADHASTAQTQFDCWVQELEENNQPRDIKRCRDGYMAAMRDVEAAMKPAPKPKMAMKPKKKKKVAKKKRKAQRYVTPYIVYFQYDSTNIAGMASVRTLTQAAKAAKTSKSKRVQVIGHADKSGNADYNLKLSERRTKMVDDALTALGVHTLTIEPSSVGETDPEVSTADGVRKAANRRVIIIVH
jgi:OOP family OmpA-OmpF porin